MWRSHWRGCRRPCSIPAHDRPYAYGSTNGSAWNAAFVFNGLDRLEGKSLEGPQAGFIPGHHYPERTQAAARRDPDRRRPRRRACWRASGRSPGERLGLEVLAALLLGAALLGALLWERRPARRRTAPASGSDPPTEQPARRREQLQFALAGALMLWLVIGIALFSDMARLHPRYTEGFTPAVAATLGIGAAWAAERRARWRMVALTAHAAGGRVYAESLLFGASALWLDRRPRRRSAPWRSARPSSDRPTCARRECSRSRSSRCSRSRSPPRCAACTKTSRTRRAWEHCTAASWNR